MSRSAAARIETPDAADPPTPTRSRARWPVPSRRATCAASSDPEGAFILKVFAVDPDQFAGAFEGDELVGFVVPEFKVAVVRPDRRRQGIGRALVETRRWRWSGRGAAETSCWASCPASRSGPRSSGTRVRLPLDGLGPGPADRIGRRPRRRGPTGHRRSLVRSRPATSRPGSRVFNEAFADHPTPHAARPED